MDGLGKKYGYLKGLMEGMDLSEQPSLEKLLNAAVDLLGDLCDHAEMQDELLDELNDYVESIDDDLSALEGDADDDDFHMIDDDEYEDAYLDGEDEDDVEDKLHLLIGDNKGEDADEDEDEGETLAGVVCPECKSLFFVGADDPADARYRCPRCENRVLPDPLTPENAPIVRPEAD